MELLAKLAEKDQEIAAVTQRFNYLKQRNANAALNQELVELQNKFNARGK